MEQANISLSLQCPNHGLAIGMLSTDLQAKKIGYCYECIAEIGGDATFLQTLKTVSSYLKDTSNFYEKCRVKVANAGQPPANFVEELSKKGERLERFSKYIDEEKDKVKKSFEEIRKNVMQIIEQKEKECLDLLDNEISELSNAYLGFETLLMIGWPEPSEILKIYPDLDGLKQGMLMIQNLNQLRAFMVRIQQDIQVKDSCDVKEDGPNKIKKELDSLICSLNVLESSPPKIRADILKIDNLENFMRNFMKGFIQQEIRVENSINAKINAPSYGSKIIIDERFNLLKRWLPQNYKFHFKLLYRGSVDGMTPEAFHQKCDGKGATITLIRCRFENAQEPRVLGGFLDQSWSSNGLWGSSKEAFLFALNEQENKAFKCPILDFQHAFHGHFQYGPTFGKGPDLCLGAGFKTGSTHPSSYSKSAALSLNQNGNKFIVEEVEVYQVQ